MKKRSKFFMLILSSLLLASCGGESPAVTTSVPDTLPPEPAKPSLTSFYELNSVHKEGSHSELYSYSYIEADYRSVNHIEKDVSKTVEPYYVRIKELSDGSFIMLFNEVKNGEGVRMLTSADGVNWGNYSTVFEPTKTKKYANPEAIVLNNGDILACAAWRITPDYLTNNSMGGIEIKRSTDNGKTWSEAYNVSTGLAWEPYFMQLRSGEVQLYWTNTTRYNLPSGNNTSTGTALLRSYDNGVTWTGNPKIPYSGQVVAKQATEYYDHVQFYTDQMPVAVELQNGTIALALESRLDRNGTCCVTMAYSPDNWSVSIPKDGVGPADKNENFTKGGAPYLAQFPSGETVLKYSHSTVYHLCIGDPAARIFTTPIKMNYLKNFSSFEMLSSGHTVLCSGSAPFTQAKDETNFTVCTQKVNLNHAITAERMNITVDGISNEWSKDAEALFVGSVSQAQMSVRFAMGDAGLGILIDRLDNDITSEDGVTVKLALPHNSISCIEITAKVDGTVKAEYIADGSRKNIEIQCASSILGTLDDGSDTDEGVITEILVPAEYLPENIAVFPTLINKDTGKTAKEDVIDSLHSTNNSKWIPVR